MSPVARFTSRNVSYTGLHPSRNKRCRMRSVFVSESTLEMSMKYFALRTSNSLNMKTPPRMFTFVRSRSRHASFDFTLTRRLPPGSLEICPMSYDLYRLSRTSLPWLLLDSDDRIFWNGVFANVRPVSITMSYLARGSTYGRACSMRDAMNDQSPPAAY